MTKQQKPQGQTTRGKTSKNRLRRVDLFINRYAPDLLRRDDPPNCRQVYLDLGFGFEPVTTLESSERFTRMNPNLLTIGVEIDPDRVDDARPYSTDAIDFRYGGFNLPLKENESARLIRAFNVLRQYDPEQVTSAYQTLTSYLIDGGLLIEGTSDPFGRIWTANLIRKSQENEFVYEGIVFSTNFRNSFTPGDFQPVLPKNLIHQMQQNSEIHSFFEDWKDAAAATVGYKQYGSRQWFSETATQLAQKGYALDLRKKMIRHGFLIWKNPDLPY